MEIQSFMIKGTPIVFPTLDKHFTPVRLVEHGQEVSVENLLITTVRYSDGKFVPPDEQEVPDVLIITGVAGTGKTWLCRYIADQWSHGSEKIVGLTNTSLLIFLDVRNIRSSDLTEYLRNHLLKNTCRHIPHAAIIPALCQLCITFIIDSMDEATPHSREMIKEVFKEFAGEGDCRIIITTRPECTESIIKLANESEATYLNITLEGFSRPSFEDFAKTVFGASNIDGSVNYDQFVEYVDRNIEVLREHIKLPITLALLIVLWRENPLQVTSITSISGCNSKLMDGPRETLIIRVNKA